MKKKLTQNKKSVVLKLPAILSCWLLVFFVSTMNNCSIAQSISTNPAYKPAQQALPVVQGNSTLTPPTVIVTKSAEKEASVKDLPYYNYKGITDLDKSKATWIADNPEEYQKMLGQPVIQNKPTNVANQQNVIVSDMPSSVGKVLPSTNTQPKNIEKKILNQPPQSNEQMVPQDYNDGSVIIKSKEN